MDNKSPQKVSMFNTEYMKVFGRISGWIIGPVIVSLILGRFLDNFFHTSPWILFALLVSSFTFSMFMIVRIAKEYMSNETK